MSKLVKKLVAGILALSIAFSGIVVTNSVVTEAATKKWTPKKSLTLTAKFATGGNRDSSGNYKEYISIFCTEETEITVKNGNGAIAAIVCKGSADPFDGQTNEEAYDVIMESTGGYGGNSWDLADAKHSKSGKKYRTDFDLDQGWNIICLVAASDKLKGMKKGTKISAKISAKTPCLVYVGQNNNMDSWITKKLYVSIMNWWADRLKAEKTQAEAAKEKDEVLRMFCEDNKFRFISLCVATLDFGFDVIGYNSPQYYDAEVKLTNGIVSIKKKAAKSGNDISYAKALIQYLDKNYPDLEYWVPKSKSKEFKTVYKEYLKESKQ